MVHSKLGKKNTLNVLRFKKRGTLVNLVSEEIQKWIYDGVIKQGERLPSQGELSHLFSVSVTVIREALKKIQSQGLIEISQGRRSIIKKLDSQAAINVLDTWIRHGHGTIEDLHEVRSILEGEIAALAAKRASDDDIAEIEKIIHKIEAANSYQERIEVDFKFHRLLAEITRNPIFGLLIETLRGLFFEYQEYNYRKVGWPKNFFIQHFTVYNAIKDRDSGLARKAMIDHLEED